MTITAISILKKYLKGCKIVGLARLNVVEQGIKRMIAKENNRNKRKILVNSFLPVS